MAKDSLNTAQASLTPAQQRDLLEALRVHPGPFAPANERVASRLVIQGMLQRISDGPGFRLTTAGLDFVTRLSAQRVIDAVNRKHEQRAPEQQSVDAAATQSDGRPTNWPFPISAHQW